jgi:hypothetical protein
VPLPNTRIVAYKSERRNTPRARMRGKDRETISEGERVRIRENVSSADTLSATLAEAVYSLREIVGN